jgi:hypothetical protein
MAVTGLAACLPSPSLSHAGSQMHGSHDSSALASAAPCRHCRGHTRSTPAQIAIDMTMPSTPRQIWQRTLLTGTGGVACRHTAAHTSTARHGSAATCRF